MIEPTFLSFDSPQPHEYQGASDSTATASCRVQPPREDLATIQMPQAAFAQWLREQRLQAKLSQAAAAKRAKISQNHWWRIEKGLSRPPRSTILQIASAVKADATEALLRASEWLPEEDQMSESVDTRDTVNLPVFRLAITTETQRLATHEDLQRLEVILREEFKRQSALIQRLAQTIVEQARKAPD